MTLNAKRIWYEWMRWMVTIHNCIGVHFMWCHFAFKIRKCKTKKLVKCFEWSEFCVFFKKRLQWMNSSECTLANGTKRKHISVMKEVIQFMQTRDNVNFALKLWALILIYWKEYIHFQYFDHFHESISLIYFSLHNPL